MRKIRFHLFLSGITLLWLSTQLIAQTVVPQAAPDPIVLTPGTSIDDLQVLLATAAQYPSTSTIATFPPNKNGYVICPGSGDYLQWDVNAPAAATYHAWVLINANYGQTFYLTNLTTGAATYFSANNNGWDKVDIGTIALPSGTSTLKLTRYGTISGSVQIKSVELLRDSDYSSYLQRMASDRADTSWLSKAGYGLFFQYGSWGFPDNVGIAKSVDQQAEDFYVPGFVQMVKNTGAKYVIWSFSWWGYKPDMPVPAIDTILGSSSYTAQRNLIGEIAAALKAQGIRFMLYYHTGTEESAWWTKQNFPTTFYTRGTGDRSTFFNNWSAVVTDIGNTLGTNLDGIFFDDGMIYYPAPFEQLEAVARTGNPSRIVSWNSWVMPRFTDFQDVYFGEGSHGEAVTGSASTGGNGIYISGPQQGLLQHGMFPIENWGDWGIHLQGQQIPSTNALSNSALINDVASASARGVPLSLDLSMYEDGTVSDAALGQLYALNNAVNGTNVVLPAWTAYNNDWANISYNGHWTLSGGRNAGDYQNDVEWTATNGDSYTIVFNGTGITLYGPMSTADGTASVELDGSKVATFSAVYGGAYTPQQHLIRLSNLANSPHTLTVTKTGGQYLQLDRVDIAN